ncbi:MAG TPA: 30S ribosomal protein S9 [Candidatus Norongarragalinales archaeon]|nr:30S ribosomal protein S9 [Candidatus Norongarragalinales archaeon]
MAVKKPTTTKKKKSPIQVFRGKRKEAKARAFLKKGSGHVYYNGLLLDAHSSPYVRQIITEPLRFLDAFTDLDAYITVQGGGTMGQAQAARVALAHALVATVGGDLKKRMIEYDRSLLVEDARRVEPKKFKGPGARARFTKSYR